jgi:hypothetical protein
MDLPRLYAMRNTPSNPFQYPSQKLTLEPSISGQMTGALVVYAATFSRYALAVTPKNYLLFGCHVTNFAAQSVQGYRYLHYWKYAPFSLGLI